MKISIVVCDDLAEERFALARMIEQFGDQNGLDFSLETVSSGDELLDRWTPGRWDIAFLDIYMDGISGVDLARRLRQTDPECAVVFATTSQDHALVGYDLQISDYLVKPFRQDEVDDAFAWILEKYAGRLRTLRLYANWEEFEVRLKDIAYIEIQGHTAFVHTGGQVISTRRGIDSLEEELTLDSFFRCHRSYLVNLDHVTGLEKRDFLMDDGTKVPISSQNLPKARQLSSDWILQKNWGR